MTASATAVVDSQQVARSRTRESAAAPWPIYSVLFGSTSVILGVIWDISWHRSIGRDTFWVGRVAIPYAFPKAGAYRLFVQVKRGGKVMTSAFDLDAR